MAFIFDASRALPGYGIQYVVPEVTLEPSGKKVPMPGRAYLEIFFSFAGSIKERDGLTTRLSPDASRPVITDRRQLRAYIMNADHHGRTNFTLGLADKTDFRVRAEGTTVVVDVRH